MGEFNDSEGLDEGEDACQYSEAVEEKCNNKFKFVSAFITERTYPDAFKECEDALYAAASEEFDGDWFCAPNIYFVPVV